MAERIGGTPQPSDRCPRRCRWRCRLHGLGGRTPAADDQPHDQARDARERDDRPAPDAWPLQQRARLPGTALGGRERRPGSRVGIRVLRHEIVSRTRKSSSLSFRQGGNLASRRNEDRNLRRTIVPRRSSGHMLRPASGLIAPAPAPGGCSCVPRCSFGVAMPAAEKVGLRVVRLRYIPGRCRPGRVMVGVLVWGASGKDSAPRGGRRCGRAGRLCHDGEPQPGRPSSTQRHRDVRQSDDRRRPGDRASLRQICSGRAARTRSGCAKEDEQELDWTLGGGGDRPDGAPPARPARAGSSELSRALLPEVLPRLRRLTPRCWEGHGVWRVVPTSGKVLVILTAEVSGSSSANGNATSAGFMSASVALDTNSLRLTGEKSSPGECDAAAHRSDPGATVECSRRVQAGR